MNQNFTMAPGPAPPTGDDTDEPDDEDADDEIPDDDEPITDDDVEIPVRRPLSVTLADFFGSTWIIWVIGFVIIGIVVYRGRRR
jgi:hypothetical protein